MLVGPKFIRAYSSVLGRVYEWKVKGHFLEKKAYKPLIPPKISTFLAFKSG